MKNYTTNQTMAFILTVITIFCTVPTQYADILYLVEVACLYIPCEAENAITLRGWCMMYLMMDESMLITDCQSLVMASCACNKVCDLRFLGVGSLCANPHLWFIRLFFYVLDCLHLWWPGRVKVYMCLYTFLVLYSPNMPCINYTLCVLFLQDCSTRTGAVDGLLWRISCMSPVHHELCNRRYIYHGHYPCVQTDFAPRPGRGICSPCLWAGFICMYNYVWYDSVVVDSPLPNRMYCFFGDHSAVSLYVGLCIDSCVCVVSFQVYGGRARTRGAWLTGGGVYCHFALFHQRNGSLDMYGHHPSELAGGALRRGGVHRARYLRSVGNGRMWLICFWLLIDVDTMYMYMSLDGMSGGYTIYDIWNVVSYDDILLVYSRICSGTPKCAYSCFVVRMDVNPVIINTKQDCRIYLRTIYDNSVYRTCVTSLMRSKAYLGICQYVSMMCMMFLELFLTPVYCLFHDNIYPADGMICGMRHCVKVAKAPTHGVPCGKHRVYPDTYGLGARLMHDSNGNRFSRNIWGVWVRTRMLVLRWTPRRSHLMTESSLRLWGLSVGPTCIVFLVHILVHVYPDPLTYCNNVVFCIYMQRIWRTCNGAVAFKYSWWHNRKSQYE